MKWWFTFLLMAAVYTAHAQRENIWMYGNGGLDFNNSGPTTIQTTTMVFSEASASVCDTNGQLQFYTDGSSVWDKNYNLMMNGTDLAGPALIFGTSSTTQGALIVPVPQAPSQYYIFSMTSVELGPLAGRLYYSIADMSLNGGLGEIVAGKKGILIDSNLTERLAGVTGTHCDIWIVSHSRNADEFRSYEITPSGINPVPVVSNTGTFNYNFYLLGCLTPSPDGKKILSSNGHPGGGGLELFDFNQTTGKLSNPLVLDNTLKYYSACFSPDQSKVYALTYFTTPIQFYQFDLSSSPATKTFLGSSDAFTKVKLAPDGKVYFQGGLASNYLGVINTPDAAFPACGYVSNALQVPEKAGAFPNIVAELICDTAASVHYTISAPCWRTSYVLQADTSGWDHMWNDSSTGPSKTVSAPGIYSVTYHTAPCVYHADTFVVSFPNGVLPQINVSASCKGDHNGKATAVTLTGDTVVYSYTWRDANNNILSQADSLTLVSSGSYTLQIRTAACDTVLQIYIPEADFHVSFKTSDTLVCVGDTVAFLNTSDLHFSQYEWQFGDGSFSVNQSPIHIYSAAGNYNVMLIGKGPVCTDTALGDVTADAPVNPFSFVIEHDSICAGQAILFTPKTDTTTMTLLWEFGDDNNILTSNIAIQHAYDRDGTQPVSLTATFRACPGLVYRDSVHVYPFPRVDLGPDTTMCVNGRAIPLLNLEVGQPGDRYLWNTGDTSEDIQARHPGTYGLTVTSGYGCATTDSIDIRKDCYLDIPNVFTPNGDGINDYFFPRQQLTKKLIRFHMSVFNRWGQLIFETNTTDGRGWDGRFNGTNQPAGVYVYLIEAETEARIAENYKGNLTLVR